MWHRNSKLCEKQKKHNTLFMYRVILSVDKLAERKKSILYIFMREPTNTRL